MDKRRKANSNCRRSTRSATNKSRGSGIKGTTLSSRENNYSLKWNLQSTHILKELAKIYFSHDDRNEEEDGEGTDVTLFSSEGDCVQAHKIVLMLCSPYFQKLFRKVAKSQRRERDGSIIVLGNVKTSELLNLIRFIYTGEVNLTSNKELEEFHEVTRLFGIEGVSSSKSAAVPTSGSSARIGKSPSATLKIKVLDHRPKTTRNYSDDENEESPPERRRMSSSTSPFSSTYRQKQKDQQEFDNDKNASHPDVSVSELESVACKIEPNDDIILDEDHNDFDMESDAGSNFSDELRDTNLLSDDDDDDDDKRKDPDVSFSKPLSKAALRKEEKSEINLNCRTGKLKGYVKIDPLPDEILKRDWRKKGLLRCVDLISRIYYCAHGKSSCPASLKIKTLADGTNIYFRNAYEHANHKEHAFGLTADQKAFVMQCLEAGVTMPSNIIHKFESSGLPKPDKLKLANMLTRLRKRVGNKYWKKKEPSKWPKRIRKKPVKNQDEPTRRRGRPSKQEIAAVAASKAITSSALPSTSDQHQQIQPSSSVPLQISPVQVQPQPLSLVGLQPHPNHYLGQMPIPLIHETLHRPAQQHPYYSPLHDNNNFR